MLSRTQWTSAAASIVLAVGFVPAVKAQPLVNTVHEHQLDIRVSSEAIARQGDAVVTQADFDAYMARIPETDRSGFLRSRNRVGEAIENLMLPRLLFNLASEEDFARSSQMLQSQLFQGAIVLVGQEYMDRYFLAQELEDYSQLAREIFLTEPELFQSEPTVDFSHVLVHVGPERGELDGMRSIFEVYERLEQGEDISELASELSDDPAVSENGGSYEGIDPGALDEAVRQALALMQAGQISEPVRSSYGWHVLRLDAVGQPEQLEWEEAEEQALELARTRHMMRARERLVQRLRSDELVVDPEQVQALLDRYEAGWQIADQPAE